jgi:hypothetical protein
VFLGEDLLAYLVLALGAAMAVGNGLAILRPPEHRRDQDDLEKAPIIRSLAFVVIGSIAAVWAIASLVA